MKKLMLMTAIVVLAAEGAFAGIINVDINDPGCVSGTGQPDPYAVVYCSIQDAIDDAASGDIINVAAGTYTITLAIDVNKGVTITGDTGNPDNVLVKYAAPQSTNNGFEIGAANITIQGIKVVNCKHGFFFDRSNTTYTGCTITHCAVETASNCGIGEIATPSTTISYNTITDCGDKGIYVRLCESASEATRTEIIGNTLSDCSKSWGCGCIQTFGSKYVYIYDNTISSTNDKGINIIRTNATGTSDRIQVIDNTISLCKYPGIQAIGSPYTYVYNNTLTQCNYYGGDGSGDWDYASIHIEDDGAISGANVIISGNTISDGINGIQTWANDVTITANEIYDMGVTYGDEKIVGGRTYKNSGILVGSNWGSGDIDPTGIVIQDNSIHDNYWGLFYSADLSNGVNASGNWFGDNTPASVAAKISDYVDYTPWLNNGTDMESGTPGFQGDFSTLWVDDDSPQSGGIGRIQEGVNLVTGSTVNVAAGTYREQLYIDHSLDLLGAGIGVSIIEAPDPVDRTTYSVTQWTGSSRTIDAIIGVVTAVNVNISGFTVDGRDVGPDNFYGVHFFDTDGSVTLCEIDNITDAATPSYSRVVSVAATHSLGQTFAIDFSSNSIPVFQKCGILIMGPGASFTVNNNTVINEPSPVIAGNGMQLSYGATGTTYQNVVQGAEYTGDDWAATGILLFESGDISMNGDEVYNCQSGVNFSDWGWVYLHQSPVNLSFTNLNLYDNEWTLGIQLSRDNSDVNMTVTDCDVLNSTGDGIDLYCTGEDPWGGSYYTGWENGDLNATITGCYVSGTALDGIWGGDYSGNVNNVSVSVFDCMFTGNVGSAINNGFTQIMDASGCYWDDPTGPTIGVKAGGTRPIMLTVSPFGSTLPEKGGSASTGLIASDKGSGETIYGNIDYTPWLGGGSPTSPGFQGDFSTLWVDDDSPQSGGIGRIQEGVNLVTGSTVNVAAGTYHNDPTDVNKQVTLLGANAEVDPAGSTDRGGETILTRDDTQSGFYVTASGVTINGFKLGTDTPQSSRRVNIYDGATDVTIKYNIIMNTWQWSGHGVYISPTSDRAEVSYNTIDNPWWEGIKNDGASDVVISNNTVRNVDLFPIIVSGRTVISGNTVLNCKDGIRVDYAGTNAGDRVEVIGNMVSYTEYAGINITGAHAYVYGNTVHHCNYWGSDDLGDWDYASIHMEASATNCIIEENTVYDGVNGIQTWANNVTITANEIYDMGVTYGDEKVVGDRTYKNSGILVGSNWGSGDIDPTGVVIQDNNIHDNYWGLFYSADLSNGVNAENNNWGASDGPEDLNGTAEAYIGQCYSADIMKNAIAEFFPVEDLGNGVSDNVDYCPWVPWSCCVVRGNVDRIETTPGLPIDIIDLTYLVDYLFKSGPPPPCEEEGNIDAIELTPGLPIDIVDLTYLVDFLFNGGPEPPPCS